MTEAAILCDRDASGVCRHCGHKARRLPHYRDCTAFVQPGQPAQQDPSPARPASQGPGAELKSLLARVGIKAKANCSCNAKARLMDERGIDWCEANIEEIVGWLREEATKRGLPFVDMAGRMLVRRAIANARKAEARRAKEAEAAAAEGPAA